MLSQLSSSWPLLRIHGETAFAKIICLRRQNNILRQWRAGFRLVELGKVQLRRPGLLIGENTHLQKDSDSFLPTPRPLPRPHFENNAADTPDVNLGIVPFLLAIDDLRCHPEHGSLHRSVGTYHVNVVRPLRDSEICNFTESELLDKNVVRFQILK